MLVYLVLTAVSLIIAYQISSTNTSPKIRSGEYRMIHRGISRIQVRNIAGLIFLFFILTGVSALRLNVGNDYSKYVEFMHRTYSNAIVPTEIGFNYLTKIIYFLSGFENYVAVFAIFAAATVFFFLKGIYDQSENFFLSFAIISNLGTIFYHIFFQSAFHIFA